MSLWERNISSSNPSWIPNQSLPKKSKKQLKSCTAQGLGLPLKKKTEFQTGISTIEHLDLHDLSNCFPCWHLGRPGIPTIHWTLLGLMLRKTPTQRKVIFRWSHAVQNRADVNKNIPNLSLPVLVAKFRTDKKNIASGFWAPCHTKPPSCNTLPWGWAKSITVLRYAWKTLRLRRLEMGRWKCLKNHSKITQISLDLEVERLNHLEIWLTFARWKVFLLGLQVWDEPIKDANTFWSLHNWSLLSEKLNMLTFGAHKASLGLWHETNCAMLWGYLL